MSEVAQAGDLTATRAAKDGGALHAPLGLLAELTHVCPLGCPYCSNPLALDPRQDELDTATWARVFGEAAALGVLQVHLSGGEPGARRDLVAIAASAHAAGLYTNLITSAVGITAATLAKLADGGLDHVQISIQDSDTKSADHIAGYAGAFARKRALAEEVVRLKIPLTVNAVIHRANIDRLEEMVALALTLGASRVEIAHAQYYGWALKNRAALMPSADQVKRAADKVEALRARHRGEIVIDAVVPDYYARLPKPCVGGWGRRSLNITPAGKVLPCHAAESISGPGILVGARTFARRHLGELAGLQRLPRHRVDGRTVQILRPARYRLRRLPLPGVRVDRGCARDRPGLPSGAQSRPRRRARRRSERGSLRLPADVTNGPFSCRSPLCIPESRICNFALTPRRATLPRAGIGRKAGEKADT